MRWFWLVLVLVGCNPYPKWPRLDSGDVQPAGEGADGEGSTPGLDISPLSIQFGGVELGRTASEAVVLTSDGDAPTILREIALLGDEAFVLEVSPGGPVQLEPGATETLRIDFSPSSEGSHEARLYIDSDGLSGSFTMGISGSGVAP